MRTIFDSLGNDWTTFVIPAAVFLACFIALLWLRRLAFNYLTRWFEKIQWPNDNFLIRSIRGPSSLLCLILSIYLGLAVSALGSSWKVPVGNALWTLFVVALTLSFLSLARSGTDYYGEKFDVPKQVVLVFRNILRVIIIVIAVLEVMNIWGVPASPLLLLFAVVILVGILAFRDSIPNLFASFQVAATQAYKVGDYIKLDGGEEGYVTNINWNRTSLQGLDGTLILIPNAILIHRKVLNYGRPLKKARRPFHFNTRAHLSELTGLKARNLTELAEILKTAPENVIYYHTHHFLEEHQYFVPELTNDFANWVKNSLDEQVLGERLANISIIEFNDLGIFRDKMVNIIETYLGQHHTRREVPDGQEFHFIKAVDVILPTSYAAHDLREFVESLRIITPGSLYFHVFGSRLRLKKDTDDFAVWLEVDMDDKALSEEFSKIDPYSYTLEGLRSLLIQTVEKHIK